MVHGLLITADTQEQMQMAHLAVCPVANHIDGRGFTQRYTVFSDDLERVLEACRKLNVTVQEIIGAGDDETYKLHHQGDGMPWAPKKRKAANK